MLGHADVGITLNLYSHVLPTMQRSAVDALEERLEKPVAVKMAVKRVSRQSEERVSAGQPS
jgi:hypothetical protein